MVLKDYSHYDVVTFASDSKFQEWVLEGLDQQYWDKVLIIYSDKRKIIEEARHLLLSIDFKVSKPDDETVEEYLRDALEKIIEKEKEEKVFPLRKWIWSAAAVAVFFLGYWLLQTRDWGKNTQTANPHEIVKDMAPGGERAVLTLADGTQVTLDSALNGQLANQGNTTVTKMDKGRLMYHSKGDNVGEVLYNSVSTPAGGVYQLVLSDGTKVWLNAMSSLRFPTSFAGDERRVELVGEGYFEVAHNAAQPFVVNVQDMEVKVLGTHFNIKAYKDEESFRTTLIEGKVLVSNADVDVELNPGQQARVNTQNTNIKKVNRVDLDNVIAWKNGEFNFDETELKEALRSMSRWYNFEIDYADDIQPAYVYGNISRNNNLSEVLKILEASGLHFEMERVGRVNRLLVLK